MPEATLDSFELGLEKNGVICYPNVGTSMQPLLREGKDMMVIEKKGTRQLQLYDAVLYRRPSITGRGRYVLHRIQGIDPDGRYFIIGDNEERGEHVREENILGILTHVVRGKKTVSVQDKAYLFYVRLWRSGTLTRKICMTCTRMLCRIGVL